MYLSEFVAYDAVGLCELIRDGQVSRDELRQVARDAIEAMNGTLNAVVHQFSVAGDSQPNRPSLLTGFPLLLKDMLDVEDTPMSYGTRVARINRCTTTHPIATRMLEAGIDIIGRTNMSELGLLPTTEPIAFGPTANPWNLDHSPGGSSGGSAAAVAGGITPMAYAADGGGSIRIPASCCGLFGLKLSRGLHPRDMRDEPFGFIVHNPVSRTVRDSAALMDVTVGGDHAFSAALDKAPGKLRVGYVASRFDGEPIHHACVDAVEHAAKVLEGLGHHVELVTVPHEITDIEWGLHVFWSMSAGYFFKEVRSGLLERLDSRIAGAIPHVRLLRRALTLPWPGGGPLVEPFTAAVGRRDRFFDPSDVWLAWTEFQKAEQAMLRFFEEYDLLLTPTLGAPPWRIGSFDQQLPAEQAAAKLTEYVPFTPLANMTGFPAVNLPLHWADGLPIGVQCMANHGRDAVLISFAAEVEQAAPWREQTAPHHLSRLLTEAPDA